MRVRYSIKARVPAFTVSILLLLLVAATDGVVYAQDPKGGPTASAPGAEVYFVNLKDGATVPAKLTIHFGLRNMGVGPAGLGSPAHRSPSSADRHRAAVARSADSERLQPSALRRRPDRGGDHALARRAHVAAVAGRQGSHPAYAAGHVGAHSGQGRRRHAGPGGRRGRGARQLRRRAPRSISSICKDGAVVPSKTTVKFGLRNMERRPAGAHREHSGHHHLLVDTELPPLDQPIPSDFNHLHYGAGQTEAEITLSPGEHTLQLLLGTRITSHIRRRSCRRAFG